MVANVLDHAEAARLAVHSEPRSKELLGQYFTSAPLAKLMASMMSYDQDSISILDPGAGVGSLSAACVEAICRKRKPPASITLTACEMDPKLLDDLNSMIDGLASLCDERGIEFAGRVVKDDFIRRHAEGSMPDNHTHAIMNPPYGKIRTSSDTYAMLASMGLQTTNKYAAFVAISQNLLRDRGQMVFITPRSFCNGTYFGRFRRRFLDEMSIRRIHLFDSRTSSFLDDGVLQENVIVSAIKGPWRGRSVTISTSYGPRDRITPRPVPYSEVVLGDDPLCFIHITPDDESAEARRAINGLDSSLDDLGLTVSTGKVVDFRVREELRFDQKDGAVPLVRPSNISGGTVRFPIKSKRHHNFAMASPKTRKLLVANGVYVLVKRFTAKEEKKRVVAAVWKGDGGYDLVGFENRTNYFHCDGAGMDSDLASGLWAFLNSTLVDSYVRQFAGSTQVNAADLRYLRYPSAESLMKLGRAVDERYGQEEVDTAVNAMTNHG